uniref:Uncharacterized protein n=1 Tax=Panagrolaimus sp. JU765 TaxID=591449 RepID=A0AC34RD81_9BILA
MLKLNLWWISKSYVWIIFFVVISAFKVDTSQCHAKCSPFLTLPCSFGGFDKCMEFTCKEICRKDGNRPMAACFCRGTVEGPTMRACFCFPSNKKSSKILF